MYHEQLLVFTSDNFRYLTLVQRNWWVVLFWLDLWWDFHSTHTGLWTWDLWMSSPALYHCCHSWLLVFTSDNFRYLTLVQRDWWWYCSDWTCDRFTFTQHQGLNWMTSGSLVLHSTTMHHCRHLVFISDNFWYFNSRCRGNDGGIVLIGPVRHFLFACTRALNWGPLASLVLQSTTAFMVTSGFHLWQFQVFNSGAEEMVVVLFWLDLWDTFFLLALRFELGTSRSLVLQSTTAAMATSGISPLLISGI